MKYLLDSDTITAVFDKESPFFDIASPKLGSLLENDEIHISILSIYELEFSKSNTESEEVIERIEYLLKKLEEFFDPLPLSEKGANFYGSLKSDFQKRTGSNRKAMKKHNIDLMIAATALENGCNLVAMDKIYKDHLQKVESRLIVENWIN